MQFRTSFDILPFRSKIAHNSSLFVMGSCFSEMIGDKLAERKFCVLRNPFGTIFNPHALFLLLETSLSETPLEEALITAHQGRFYHYQAHSKLSASSKEQLVELISHQQQVAKRELGEASHLFVTFGTAHVYELVGSGQVVANCHKQPRELFQKRLLQLSEMMDSFRNFYKVLQAINPSAEIIVTVSPVRHIKDGIPENQLSKSLLRVLCHEMSQECQQVNYFPSYELMMDDLRDYRYYKDDMIHPTSFAENYIWEQFKKGYFDDEALNTIKKIDAILNDLQHKPFHTESASHQQFLQKLLTKMEQMGPTFDFSKEISVVTHQLNSHYKNVNHESQSQ